MKLALVFNPFKYKVHEENLRITQKYFGLFPPLSLAWVAAIAEKAGHEVALVDARTLRLGVDEVAKRLEKFKPDIMGFMMTTYMYRDTLQWIRELKRRIPVPVVVGGYNLRVYPKESIAPPEIDFGVHEQAFHTVPALLEALEKGGKSFSEVPGLVYKEGGETHLTPHPQPIDFDLYPNPARHLLPNELYAEFPTQRKNFTVMVTSLGCPRRCLFCEAGGAAYSPRSPQTVVSEMEECSRRFGIREIDIFDYDFTFQRSRVIAICDEIIARKLDITWACRARVDEADEDLLAKMKEAGCSRIYYGVESGVQEILDTVRKGITLDQIRRTVAITKKLGIMTLGFFIIGAPGETRETVRQTLRFARTLDLDYVQFNKLLAKPLTPLWRQMVEETGYDYWREWILGNVEDRPLPRPWVGLTNEEVDSLAKWAYVKYHSHPLFLLKATLKVKSLTEFTRKARAFLDMVLSQEDVSQYDDNFVAYDENPGWKRDRFRKD